MVPTASVVVFLGTEKVDALAAAMQLLRAAMLAAAEPEPPA